MPALMPIVAPEAETHFHAATFADLQAANPHVPGWRLQKIFDFVKAHPEIWSIIGQLFHIQIPVPAPSVINPPVAPNVPTPPPTV